MGLHKRYADLLGSKLPSVTLANSPEDNYRIQARKWASIISDPELRELAEEAAELVLRKGFDLPEIVEKDLGKRRNGITLASYQSGVFPKIYINTNKQIKKLGGIKKIREAAVERGWSSQPNTILHELAHHMDYVMQENYRSTKPGDLFDKLDEEQVKKILSEYGSSEPAEFRAELYAAILAGKTFPKEFLEAAYLTTYPDDRTQALYQMGSGEIPNVSMLEREFGNMMEALFTEDGASLRIDILGKDEVQGFIQEHANVLGSSLGTADMSELMRSRLEESNYIFSGIKAFHELNEAFPSLLDEEGKRKPFERFLNDVQSIDETYNKHYLNAEYNFAQASAEMAGKWEQFTEDGDDYLLQYRTANDSKVRPEHAELHGVTLPMGDSFWDEYYPPNGWNCRCTVVQVLKSKYEQTPHAEAMQRAEQALLKDTKGMFHFNPGKTGKSFPDHNPYTLRRCTTCDLTKLNLASDVADNDICAACRFVRGCYVKHEEIIQNGKGYIKINQQVNREDSDFDKLYRIAEALSKDGATVELTPKMTRPSQFKYDCIYESLKGSPYYGKCPDLRVDGVWYEHEGFITDNPKNAFRNMLTDGLRQCSRLIIDQPDLTDAYMKRIIRHRISQGQEIDEILILSESGLRTLYKKFEE